MYTEKMYTEKNVSTFCGNYRQLKPLFLSCEHEIEKSETKQMWAWKRYKENRMSRIKVQAS